MNSIERGGPPFPEDSESGSDSQSEPKRKKDNKSPIMSTEILNLLAPDPGSPREDIYDLEEYLFVSRFYLDNSAQSKQDPSLPPTNFRHADDRLVK